VIAALVLAAGRGERFGANKLVAALHGKPLVRWVVERAIASGVDETVVVTAPDSTDVRVALDSLPVRVVQRHDDLDEMSASLRAGLDAISPRIEAIVVFLGDQPGIDPALIWRLVAAWRASQRPIVAPSYHGTRGNPVLFDTRVFAELRAVAGDRGAREVIARDPERVKLVAVDADMPGDVDVPDDLSRIEERWPPT
jgi:molybdenum cofactor cytidylyltransferase